MKRALAGLAFLAWIVTGTSCAATYSQSGTGATQATPAGPVGMSYFYDNLANDGQWFQNSEYGWCWTPYEVSEDWRPYSAGHWVYSDYGWSWASDESFGWATYHYGRWFFDDSYGWVWVPGSEWAPAWVAWRMGDDYVGWAPLPPRAIWNASTGLSFADASAIPSHQWAFVPRGHLLDVRLSLQLTSVARNVTLLGRSRDATRFEVREGRPANTGLDVAQIEASLGRPVPRVRIADAGSPAQGRGRESGYGSVNYFRPRIQSMPAEQAMPRSAAVGRPAISDADMQRQRDDRNRKLESDLAAERARLAREHQDELGRQAPGVPSDEIRKRQADEQQVFEAHAAQQRQVLAQRMQKQVVKPARAAKPARGADRPASPGGDKAKQGDKGDKGGN